MYKNVYKNKSLCYNLEYKGRKGEKITQSASNAIIEVIVIEHFDKHS